MPIAKTVTLDAGLDGASRPPQDLRDAMARREGRPEAAVLPLTPPAASSAVLQAAAPLRPARKGRPGTPGAHGPAVRWRPALTAFNAVLSMAALLLAWHLAVAYRLDFYVRFTNIPAPLAVWEDARALFGQARFQKHVLLSLQRIFLGFAVATVLGVAMGLVLGRSRMARELVFPALEVLRPIPAIAWVPMSIMLWPSNEVSIVFITFLGAFFPILLNTLQGVQTLDQVLVRAAQSLGATRRALFLQVILPGALPHVFTGLALGMGVAWVSLIAAEMISGQFGIGYFTWEAYSLVHYSEIVLGMVVIGALGLACSGLIRLAGRSVMPWAAGASSSRP